MASVILAVRLNRYAAGRWTVRVLFANGSSRESQLVTYQQAAWMRRRLLIGRI
jgi:hypothetical protein